MSQENVEVVRLANEWSNGEDLVPIIRECVEGVTDWSDTDAVVAAFTTDPIRHMHPEVEWDASALQVLGVARGLYELALWWKEWVEAWERYIYETTEYRDLGDWVLTVLDVRARGRGGIPVHATAFPIWRVRDGKIVIVRVLGSKAQALKAVGLKE